jgi:hypothetical protein
VNFAVAIVPVEVNAHISGASPVCSHLVMFFEDTFEVIHIFFVHVLDAKVIHDEGELNGSSLVFPKPWYKLPLGIPVLVEEFFEEFVG